MRILQVGDFRFSYYDLSLFDCFKKNNYLSINVFRFAPYFLNYQYKNIGEKIRFTLANRYKFGSIVRQLNQDLIDEVERGDYDIVFLWRAVHLYPSTIQRIKKHAVVIGYNNDQTFSDHHPWWLFRLLKQSIPYYDHFFVYRPSDIAAIERLGTDASVFMPTFDVERIFPIASRTSVFDVAFVGHYEDDGRDELLLKMIQSGFKVMLKGQRWNESQHYSALKSALGEIVPAYDDYNEALNSAKVCLSFLSKLNNDTYTRRTLEIPATRTVMLAEYTEDQARMFVPDKEAVYFSSHTEALEKLAFLVNHPQEREAIALASYAKVINGPYQLTDRVNEILKIAGKYLR
ncbi:Spore protein YkvP [Vibrio cholerae]|nr:putative glycosyltransferase [Vibrio cholerae]GHW26528.1 Spore protein YkvP [Vibrio cholerae]